MSGARVKTGEISGKFHQASGTAKPTGRSKSAPFSLRFTDEERAYLEQLAGHRPLGAYIREILLREFAAKRRIYRKPHIDEKQIALVLAELGQSRLSSNINQLARSVNDGTLDVSEDIEQHSRRGLEPVTYIQRMTAIAWKLPPPWIAKIL